MPSFTPIDDFKSNSFRPICPMTGLGKQKASPYKADYEVDEFILRGPEITFYDGRGDVSLGFFDVRPQAIREAAQEHLNMVPEHIHAQVKAEAAGAAAALADALREVDGLRDQVRGLILANAELITEVAGVQDALQEAYDELYPDAASLTGDVYDLTEDERISLEVLREAEDAL